MHQKEVQDNGDKLGWDRYYLWLWSIYIYIYDVLWTEEIEIHACRNNDACAQATNCKQRVINF